MPKLYTKKGDRGYTYLYDGNNIPKSSLFFEVVGNLDELSSNIGLLVAFIEENDKEEEKDSYIFDINYLRKIQVIILDIGSNIAVYDKKKLKNIDKIELDDILEIEKNIDIIDSYNNKLTDFILPGKYKGDSQCHICRVITRRVERSLCRLNDKNIDNVYGNTEYNDMYIDEKIFMYINRLSDYFFALARFLSKNQDIKKKDIELYYSK